MATAELSVVVIVALLVRVMRSSMIEELSKDYVITALAKGAAPKTVYFRHARRNALIPVVTMMEPMSILSREPMRLVQQQ